MKREHVFILGLTGSIGMGKSTVAGMFSDLGAVIIDSDSIVHGLLDFGGGAVDEVLALYPEARVVNSAGLVGVDRDVLGELVLVSGDVRKLGNILHPLIADRRSVLLSDLERGGKFCLVVLDVPLLFENYVDRECDFVIVISAGEDVQRERVMARKGMTEEKFKSILEKQMPDAEKRKRADVVLDTSCALDETSKQVKDIYTKIKSGEL